MAISPRANLDPTAAATAWATRVGASGAKWLKGIEAPRRLPNLDPARNTAAWQAGVAAAAPKFTAKITGQTYLDALDKGATAKQGNYSAAGARSQPQMQAAMSKVLPAIQAIVASLPPRGPRGSNGARSQQLQDALYVLRGTL